MTRKIKFRIMRLRDQDNTWLCDDYDLKDLIEMDGFGFLDDGDIIEQYTGLKDKNGKEIYEGDIVKIEAYSRVFQVVYRKWDCSFVYENDEDEEIAHMFDGFPDEYEIIGNIHENPELLKEASCQS